MLSVGTTGRIAMKKRTQMRPWSLGRQRSSHAKLTLLNAAGRQAQIWCLRKLQAVIFGQPAIGPSHLAGQCMVDVQAILGSQREVPGEEGVCKSAPQPLAGLQPYPRERILPGKQDIHVLQFRLLHSWTIGLSLACGRQVRGRHICNTQILTERIVAILLCHTIAGHLGTDLHLVSAWHPVNVWHPRSVWHLASAHHRTSAHSAANKVAATLCS